MVFIYTIIFMHFILKSSFAADICDQSKAQDFSVCTTKDSPEVECVQSTVPLCRRNHTEVSVDLQPFKDVFKDYITYALRSCCGACKTIENVKNYGNSVELSDAHNANTVNSSFIYPVLGLKETTSMFGYQFVPVLEISKATLVTLKPSGEDLVKDLIYQCLNLWPLLTLILLMALNTGCIIWVFETRECEEEFPRNFFHGWYQGFWWAFISMTTVGYGDKTVRSFVGRLFAVFWILIGITIFSMLTATLTSLIQNAGLPPSTDISGKKMVVRKHYLMDAVFVLSRGGIVHEEIGLNTLWNTLQDESIYGLMMDFLSSTYGRKEIPEMDRLYEFQDIDVSSKGFMYGILVRDEMDYKYLRHFTDENGLIIKACIYQDMNTRNHTIDEVDNLFHPDRGLFWVSFTSLLISFLVMVIIGAIYETWRRKNKKKKLGTARTKQTHLAADMQNTIDAWKKNIKESDTIF